jgi:hypothetical protein
VAFFDAPVAVLLLSETHRACDLGGFGHVAGIRMQVFPELGPDGGEQFFAAFYMKRPSHVNFPHASHQPF